MSHTLSLCILLGISALFATQQTRLLTKVSESIFKMSLAKWQKVIWKVRDSQHSMDWLLNRAPCLFMCTCAWGLQPRRLVHLARCVPLFVLLHERWNESRFSAFMQFMHAPVSSPHSVSVCARVCACVAMFMLPESTWELLRARGEGSVFSLLYAVEKGTCYTQYYTESVILYTDIKVAGLNPKYDRPVAPICPI